MSRASRLLTLTVGAILLSGCGLVNVPACVFGNGYQFQRKDGSNTTVAFKDGDSKVFIGSTNYLSVGYPCAAIAGVETQPSEVRVTRNGTPITPAASKRTVNQYFPEPLGLHLLDINDTVEPGQYAYELEAVVDGKPSGKQRFEIDTAASPLKGVPALTVTGTSWQDTELSWTPVTGAKEYVVSFSVDDERVREKVYWTSLVTGTVPAPATTFRVADFLKGYHPDNLVAPPGLVAAANELKKPIKVDVRAQLISGRINWMASSKTLEITPGAFTLPAPTFEKMRADALARDAQK